MIAMRFRIGLTRPAGAILQPEPWGRLKVTLSVSEWFRGAAGNTLVVRTEVGTEACGYPFEVGHEYLVFANEYQGNVTVTTCSPLSPRKWRSHGSSNYALFATGSLCRTCMGSWAHTRFVGTKPGGSRC